MDNSIDFVVCFASPFWENQGEVSRTFPSRTFRGMRGSEKNVFFANKQKQSSFLYSK